MCTFSNHESMVYCEMCGVFRETFVKSAKDGLLKGIRVKQDSTILILFISILGTIMFPDMLLLFCQMQPLQCQVSLGHLLHQKSILQRRQ
jgi:hypothetical protein